MLQPDLTYQLLRNLTSPVVAITSVRDGKENGMISDAAVRASIVPTVPRLSVFIHKFNYSHDMIYETGRFAMHLLHTKQFDLVRRLGFFSGRDQDKLAGIPHHNGKLGVPIFDDCFAHFECSVVNVMDTGSSTLFLGDVIAVGRGTAAAELLTATYFRTNMPAAWRNEYEAKLQEAQQVAAEMYAENATFMPPNQSMVQGRAAIRAWIKTVPPMSHFTASAIEINGCGDLAYVRGTYQVAYLSGATEHGKFLEIRRGEKDGRWLIVADIFNSDVPTTTSSR